MDVKFNLHAIPTAFRQAGASLRLRRKLPGGFGQRAHDLMREHGAAIKGPMLAAMQYNPPAGTGRLLAEVLIKHQLEPATCIEVISSAGKMMLRLADRDEKEIKEYFIGAAATLKDASVSQLVQYLEMVSAVSGIKLDVDLYVWRLKTKKNDQVQAAADLAELDTYRAYNRQEIRLMVAKAVSVLGMGFIGHFAAVRAYGVRQLRDLIINIGGARVEQICNVLCARGFTSLAQQARFLLLFSAGKELNYEACMLSAFCLKSQYDWRKTSHLVKKYLSLRKISLHRTALFINKMASYLLGDALYLGFGSGLDCQALGKTVKALVQQVSRNKEQMQYLAKVIVRERGLKGDRAQKLLDLITSSPPNL